MRVTDRKNLANRANAKKSTGPRSVEGKQISRENSLKHGLTAEIVPMFDEDPEALAAEQAAWVQNLAPVGHVAKRLAERAFLAYVKINRYERAKQSVISRLVEEAERKFNIERESRLAYLVEHLDKTPETILHELKQTMAGVLYLRERWRSVLRNLDRGHWTRSDSFFALPVLGVEVEEGRDFETMLCHLELYLPIAAQLAEMRVDHDLPVEQLARFMPLTDAHQFDRIRKQGREERAWLKNFAAKMIQSLTEQAKRLEADEARRLLEVRRSVFSCETEQLAQIRRLLKANEASLHRLQKAAVLAGQMALEVALKGGELGLIESEPEEESDSGTDQGSHAPAAAPSIDTSEPAAAAPRRSQNEPTAKPALSVVRIDATDAKPVDSVVNSVRLDEKPPLS